MLKSVSRRQICRRATYCMEPAYIKALIARAKRTLKLLALRIIPYPNPKTRYPVITGIVARKAGFNTFLSPSAFFFLEVVIFSPLGPKK